MKIFQKIFGAPSKPATGNSAVVSALLQSIKRGADAKAQVDCVRSVMGDSIDDTLKGYLDDLSGDEVKTADAETLSKAIDVVDAYCKKICGDACDGKVAKVGDEVKTPQTEKKPEEKEPVPAPEKKEAEKKEPEKKEPEKQAGDSIDYEKLASMVADKLKPAEPKKEEPQKQMGDELEVSRLSTLLAGDEKTSDVTSDALMNGIYGGK